jgi:hypothetical protein
VDPRISANHPGGRLPYRRDDRVGRDRLHRLSKGYQARRASEVRHALVEAIHDLLDLLDHVLGALAGQDAPVDGDATAPSHHPGVHASLDRPDVQRRVAEQGIPPRPHALGQGSQLD